MADQKYKEGLLTKARRALGAHPNFVKRDADLPAGTVPTSPANFYKGGTKAAPKGAGSTTPRALAATPRAAPPSTPRTPARGKADLARPKPAPKPAAPRPAAPKMTDGQKLRASLRADKEFMGSIKSADHTAPKAAAKATPKTASKIIRGHDSYKRFMGE
jgi:hypothetical protein